MLQIPLRPMTERFGGRTIVIFRAVAIAGCAISLRALITTPFVWAPW